MAITGLVFFGLGYIFFIESLDKKDLEKNSN
jgi:hypothetical protein